MVKKLQHDSDYAALDTDGDGIVTDAEPVSYTHLRAHET